MISAYLATCYYDDSDEIRFERFKQVTECAGWLYAQGYAVYSPITQGRMMATFCDFPHDYSFWQKADRLFISLLAEFIVYIQQGWKSSTGLRNEVSHAVLEHKPIKYVRLYNGSFEWVSPAVN